MGIEVLRDLLLRSPDEPGAYLRLADAYRKTDRVHHAAVHNLENRGQARDGQSQLRLCFGMGDVKMRIVVGAGREHIQAVPAAVRGRDCHGPPAFGHTQISLS